MGLGFLMRVETVHQEKRNFLTPFPIQALDLFQY